MCGIAGIYDLRGEVKPQQVREMTSTLRHRGPDDEGFFLMNTKKRNVLACGGADTPPCLNLPRIENHFGKSFDLVLGFRRLSILDLSPAGHQPMGNEDGSLWILHNGEIYNYVEIRKELERMGHRFITQTDTEVILHAYEEWGTDCLKRFNGMWAFAILDLKKNKIFCARDRAGVKPFYYTFNGQRFVFASEIKALLALDEIAPQPNDQIVADYLFSGVIDHTQETFFKNIYQLRGGEYLLFEKNRVMVKSYWDIEPKEVRLTKESDYVEQFYELLEDSIRLRLRSDVPVGTCLSGGLDSSSIVCLANKLMFDGQIIDPKLVGQRQKTFSSCFENHAYDERGFIKLVIDQTGADKNYVFPEAENLSKDLTKLIWHQEEPFGSTSIYAQWNVMKLAKELNVTVLLDGQGGDELLAGYIPAFYHLFASLLRRGHLGRFVKELNEFRTKHGMRLPQLSIGMISALISPRGKFNLRRMTKNGIEWANKDFLRHYLRPFTGSNKFKDTLNNYLYQAFRFVALPGLLHYEDRNSMAFSLEARLPFLDFRLVEYLFSLPPEQKIGKGVSKVVLRNAMKGILPEEVRNRKDKMGFATPEDIWFRTVLKNTINGIINSKSFSERGFFDMDKVKKAFDKHCEGKINISFMIWRWVNLEMWFKTFIDRSPSEEC